MRPRVFTAQPLMLAGPGFSLFGPEHLAWLAVAVLWIWLLRRHWRVLLVEAGKQGEKRRSRYLRAVACLPLALLVSEDALMIFSGTFTAPWWPLHFCNFAEYACFLYALRPNRCCRELLLTLGLTGGCVALLFPGWSYCPAYTWPVICGFMEHATIFAISCMALSEPLELPRWRDMWFSFGFVGAYVLFFRWFNQAFSTNFGFITRPAEGSPLAWWEQALGNPGYLVPYAACFVAYVLVMHGACEKRRRRALA